ncbi:RHS repeat domain-containing protein [Paenibacillus sp. HW567]|uniref:RHS repeat domain-containing protein n=1 Tax=Paenibacillus sp. HW567 TaxID=1034769 RepID=UPI000375ED22|nr:RHS repeat domain-containing protein [Paenibacillus sp. HW567]
MKRTRLFIYLLQTVFFIFMLSINQSKAFAAENIIVPRETFESGSYAGTSYVPVYGAITSDPQKVVNGKYSTFLSALPSEVWKEFNYTDQSKVKFEKNTTYAVTFSYKSIDMKPADANRFFYFLARSTDNDIQEDKGYTSWTDASGDGGIRTMTFTTGNKDNYYLIWGIHGGGALSMDDIQIVKTTPASSESFEKGSFTSTNFLAGSGVITSDPAKIVSGQYSAYLSSLRTEDFKAFAYTDRNKVKFEKNTTYKVTFAYKAIDMEPAGANRCFYFLARSTDDSEDKGWTTWNEVSGNKGTRTVTFTTGNKENYYLIWGIYKGGALSIDDIEITKTNESFESGAYTNTNFTAGYGTITNDPAKVITGQYSAYLTSQLSEVWKEFTYSDPNKYKFEGNTTYSVTFSYKSIDMDASENERFFYFLARSTDNLEDKGWMTWKAATGNKGKKTVTFTTGSKANYYLIWGIHQGGALSLDDIKIEKVSESFEQGSYSATNFLPVSGIITSDPAKVVNGLYSAYLSPPTDQGGNEFVCTDSNKVKFQPNTTYTVSFAYKAIDMQPGDDNRYFYFTARGMDNTEMKGWTIWNDVTGTKGTKTVTFTTGNQDNYYMFWGIHGGGALSIDDIVIQQLTTYQYDANGRLVQVRMPDNQVVRYSYDRNGNLISTKVD